MFWCLLQKIRNQSLPSTIERNPVRSSALATSLHTYARQFQIRARAQCYTNARAQALDARTHIRSIADIDDRAQIRSIAKAQGSSVEPQQLSTTFFFFSLLLFVLLFFLIYFVLVFNFIFYLCSLFL